MALQELQCEATRHLLSRRRSPPRGLPSINSQEELPPRSSPCTTMRTLARQQLHHSQVQAHSHSQESQTPSLQQTEATQSWPLQHQPLNTSSQLPHHLHQPSRMHPRPRSLQAGRDTSASDNSPTRPAPPLSRAAKDSPSAPLNLFSSRGVGELGLERQVPELQLRSNIAPTMELKVSRLANRVSHGHTYSRITI